MSDHVEMADPVLPVEGVPSAAEEPPPPAPVAAGERVASVDVLRGVALLGILAMNIVAFAWPFAVYDNPSLAPGYTRADVGAWLFNEFVFSGKMMSTFSMLFGAGLVLMSGRLEARGTSVRGVYYRRVLWLLAFGLVHAYLIWAGDILYAYAVCGLILYPFRRKSPRTLIALGVALILVSSLVMLGAGSFFTWLERTAPRVESAKKAGRPVDKSIAWVPETWRDIEKGMRATPEEIRKEIKTYRGGYAGIVKARAKEVFFFQTYAFVFFIMWGTAGRMLLGMGLMKLGVFSAERSDRFYRRLALFGYGVGLPLTAVGVWDVMRHRWDMIDSMAFGMNLANLGTVPVALGHAAVVMLLYRAGVFQGLLRRLAAVGRMALTNYLTHSIVCTTLFYGYGFGLFGHVGRVWLFGVVLAIWAAQLWYSPIWLRSFRFGPAEWLWRSLTYGRPQPMRPPSVAASSA
jgi:uncharacterized protein